jgi:hypothetical protein
MIKASIHHKYAPQFLFSLVALLGLLNIPNIGISWDEPGQRLSAGLSVIKVVNKIDPGLVPSGYSEFSLQAEDLSKNAPFDHGVAFDAPILALETIFGIDSTRGIYLLHHVVNWLGYLVGLAAMYLLIFQVYKRRSLALLGASIFVLSPRILAEGFYNSKDLTFLSFLLLSCFFTLKIWEGNNRSKFAILAGLVGGYATDIRILGLVQVPIVAFVFILIYLIKIETFKSALRQFLLFLMSFSVTVYLFFPYLWENPIGNLIRVFRSMSKYNWDGFVLYSGERIQAQDLPWHYIPVWISITTPILYIILFAIGVMTLSVMLVRRIRMNEIDVFAINQIFILSMFFAPLIIVIGLNSTLYDGWRHMYFIYPFLIAIGIHGYTFLESKLRNRAVLLRVAVVLSLTSTLVWVVANNPQQNLYFNKLAGENIAQDWEMDYWGLSNESALRYILEKDSREKITVQEVSFTPLEVSSKMLNSEEQARLIFERNATPSAEYLVNNFRSGNQQDIPAVWPGYESVKKYEVDGFTYLEVLKKAG